MLKVLKALAWAFTVATLVVGIIALSGNETAIAYIPASAGIMAALISLYLVLLNREKKRPINH